jgi:DNA-binding NtrC family response regulator
MDKLKALVVDDEDSICEVIRAIIEAEGIDVATTTSSAEAVELIRKTNFDIIISDLKMPDISGIDLFEMSKEISPDSIFIIVTAYGTIQSAVDAVKKGIYDYIQKPFTPDEVRIPVRRARDKKTLERENIVLRSQIESRYAFRNIIGGSPQMQETFRIMKHASSSDSNVLISGESGTGKELVARSIHSNSSRARRKFAVVNCGAIPDGFVESELFGYLKGAVEGAAADRRGLLEEADRGTLFLDEVGELSPALQVKLLRAISGDGFMRVGGSQLITVNLRIIAATNRALKKLISEKMFREDLFYRLNIIPVRMAPLRERKEDIPLLVNYFIQKHRIKVMGKEVSGISKEALHAIMNYHFPGNVRELENAVEYAIDFTEGPLIQRDDLPAYIASDTPISEQAEPIPIMPLKEAKAQLEKGLIMAALINSGGNISEASRQLNVHRQHLQQKIRLLGIDLASIHHTS